MSTTEHSIEEQETPLDPDEPRTPNWFTFLGVGLFLLGGIFLLATAGDEEPAPASAKNAAAQDADSGAAPAAAQDAPSPNAPADPHAGHGHD